MTEPEPRPSFWAAVVAAMNSPLGNALLVAVWPLIIAAIGLPTGAAQAALDAYQGPQVLVCPPCAVCPEVETPSIIEVSPDEATPTP